MFKNVIKNIKDGCYEVFRKVFPPKKSNKAVNKKVQDGVFLVVILCFPILQFIVFYIGVNFRSILLAFQKYDVTQINNFWGGFVFDGEFTAIKNVFNELFTGSEFVVTCLKNSGIQFLVGLFIGIPLNVFAAYCIWKKTIFAGFFKVVIFLPTIVPSIVFVAAARPIFSVALPELIWWKDVPNLLSSSATGFWTVLFYGVFITFSSGLVIYLGAMSSISDEIIEYGQLEGIGAVQELFRVVVPLIFPTITTYLIIAIAGYFTNYGQFYSFYGNRQGFKSEWMTFGYFLFTEVVETNEGGFPFPSYPRAAAYGLIFTVVATPLTLITKSLLEKYGPSEE